jgi:predicted transcriptional regulator of viral defense system
MPYQETFTDALEAEIVSRDDPIVTEYGFHLLGMKVLGASGEEGPRLTYKPASWDVKAARNAIRRLVGRGVLARDWDFSRSVWRCSRSSRAGSAEEVACIADVFCYVSHLSAMQRYGLTNRAPQALHLTTPAPALWASMRSHKVSEDYPSPRQEHPALTRPRPKRQLRGRTVVFHETGHPSAARPLRGEGTRVTTIGATFTDMLSEPDLCGGMRHVLEVWDAHARAWAEPIIEAVDACETKLVKVRAGHILEERLRIADPRIAAWTQFAQRGGSQKLDPEGPYVEPYSERWMISLNV